MQMPALPHWNAGARKDGIVKAVYKLHSSAKARLGINLILEQQHMQVGTLQHAFVSVKCKAVCFPCSLSLQGQDGLDKKANVMVASSGAVLEASTSYCRRALTSHIRLNGMPSLRNDDLATALLSIAQSHVRG